MLDFIEFKEIIRTLMPSNGLTVIEDENITGIEYRDKKYLLLATDFDRLIAKLDEKNTNRETALYDANTYEVFAKEQSARIPFLRMRDGLKIEDPSNGFTYEYSPCSEEYILFILGKIHEADMVQEFKRARVIPWRHALDRIEQTEESSLLKVINEWLRFDTLKIKSLTHKRTVKEFEDLCHSVLFHIGFNLDVALIEIRYLDELLRTNRLLRVRRVNPNEIDPPKRKYVSELVYHYQMAISTDSPMLQFLSYYHVLEHFFEHIYNEDLVGQVVKEITRPDFSSKRTGDIKKLIKLVTTRLRDRGETFAFNEQDALILTILKCVDMEGIVSKLDDYDSKLVSYYRDFEVPFSKGNRVDFGQENETAVKQLSARIYKTRNSIVHSKDNDKARFLPFINEKELLNEIPLMRFLAEQVIVETSDVI